MMELRLRQDDEPGRGPLRRGRAPMTPAAKALRKAISAALVILRTRMRWSQDELAAEINNARPDNGKKLRRETISRWELEAAAPSPSHRVTLHRIAAAHGHHDLAGSFQLRPQ